MSLHFVNVWREPEIGKLSGFAMPTSLLFQPDDRRLGQWGPAVVYVGDWNGYPFAERAHDLGPAAAARGVTLLSLGLRRRGVEGGATAMPDHDTEDIRMAIDYLAAGGLQDIALIGEGVGALSVARYQARAKDFRVRALALLDPVLDAPAWLRAALGDDAYAKQVRHSSVAARQMAGDLDLVRVRGTGPDGRERLVHQFSTGFLNWWGPNADTRLADHLPRVANIVGVVGGGDALKLARRGEAIPGDSTGMLDWCAKQLTPSVPEAAVEWATARLSSGRTLNAFFWQPQNPGDTAILMVHGLTGGPTSPTYAKQAPHFCAKGFPCLVVETRRSGLGGSIESPAPDQLEDLRIWLDWLQARGYDRVVLQGASLGSIDIMRFQARTRDQRVVALVHQAPTAECSEWAKRGMGASMYAEVTARARKAVSEGRPGELIDEVWRRGAPDKLRLPMRYPQSAESWLSWWGPDADTSNLKHIRAVRVPILLVSGTEDNYNDTPRMEELEAAATASDHVEALWYDDCDHGFVGFERRLVDDVVGFLGRAGLR